MTGYTVDTTTATGHHGGMDAALIEQLTAYAQRLARALEGRNAEARAIPGRRRGTVHAVGTAELVAGIQIPAPRCHTGFSGGELGALTPTYRAVNCRRCLTALGVTTAQNTPGIPTLF